MTLGFISEWDRYRDGRVITSRMVFLALSIILAILIILILCKNYYIMKVFEQVTVEPLTEPLPSTRWFENTIYRDAAWMGRPVKTYPGVDLFFYIICFLEAFIVLMLILDQRETSDYIFFFDVHKIGYRFVNLFYSYHNYEHGIHRLREKVVGIWIVSALFLGLSLDIGMDHLYTKIDPTIAVYYRYWVRADYLLWLKILFSPKSEANYLFLYASGPDYPGYILYSSIWVYLILFVYIRLFWMLYQLWKEYPSSEAKEVFTRLEDDLLKKYGVTIVVDPEEEDRKKAAERAKRRPTPKRGDKAIPNHTAEFLAEAKREFAQEAYDRTHPKPWRKAAWIRFKKFLRDG